MTGLDSTLTDGTHAPAAAPALDRVVTVASVAVAGAVTGWAALDPASLATAAPAIAAGGIVLGVPHGAVDHLVPGWAAAGWRSPSRRVAVLTVYVLVAATAAAALRWAPEVSVAVFLLVAALHFGRGETVFAAERGGRSVARAWPTLVHGAVVIVLPLSTPGAQTALSPLAPGLVGLVARVPTALVTATVAAAVVLTVVWRLRRREPVAAGELAVLTALFLLAPPLAAFGVYFGLWHALRHTSRLLPLIAPGRTIAYQFGAYVRAAALPTAAALAVLAALWVRREDGVVLLAGVSVLLALTFPHVLTVALLDRHLRRHQPRAMSENRL